MKNSRKTIEVPILTSRRPNALKAGYIETSEDLKLSTNVKIVLNFFQTDGAL